MLALAFQGGTALRFLYSLDVYDLLWYLTASPPVVPNLTLLNNALALTGGTGARLDESSWPLEVRRRLLALDWKAVVSDGRPFLEDPAAADLLTQKHLLAALARATGE